MKNPKTLQQLLDLNICKGDLPKLFDFENHTFDYALPQQWLDNFVIFSGLEYDLVLSTTFWFYPENRAFSVWTDCQKQIDLYEEA